MIYLAVLESELTNKIKGNLGLSLLPTTLVEPDLRGPATKRVKV